MKNINLHIDLLSNQMFYSLCTKYRPNKDMKSDKVCKTLLQHHM